MDTAVTISLLWLGFGASHMLMSSVWLRPRLVGVLGELPFLGVYSLVSFATFVPLCWVYFANKHAGPHLWYLGAAPGMRLAVYVGMGIAVAILVAGMARPSPASIVAGKPEPAGVLRITRHPVFMAVGIFGSVHLFATSVSAADLAFFGGFPVFALLGAWHQDTRKLVTGTEEFRHFHGVTPFLPFSAPAGLLPALREDALPIVIGVGVAVLLRWFHPNLFGG